MNNIKIEKCEDCPFFDGSRRERPMEMCYHPKLGGTFSEGRRKQETLFDLCPLKDEDINLHIGGKPIIEKMVSKCGDCPFFSEDIIDICNIIDGYERIDLSPDNLPNNCPLFEQRVIVYLKQNIKQSRYAVNVSTIKEKIKDNVDIYVCNIKGENVFGSQSEWMDFAGCYDSFLEKMYTLEIKKALKNKEYDNIVTFKIYCGDFILNNLELISKNEDLTNVNWVQFNWKEIDK